MNIPKNAPRIVQRPFRYLDPQKQFKRIPAQTYRQERAIKNGLTFVKSRLSCLMPAFKIYLSNGTDYVTSMAEGVTLEEATAYFLNRELTLWNETTSRVIKVEQV